MDDEEWDYSVFEEETLLNRNIYYDIRNGKLKNPTKETVIAVCIGLNAKPTVAEELLHLSGHVLRNTPEDQAYKMLVSCCYDRGIDFANDLLELRGMNALGSRERK